eukprot:1448618-Heterocapsa_arctica.AAC.1
MDTKAAVIESILGLGYIVAKKGYKSLKDMPDIINAVEKDLISFHHKNFKHKMKGQHPVTMESWKDYDIMGDGTSVFMKDWPWTG